MDIVESMLPMFLDVYTQTETQDPSTGSVKKEWNFNKTVPCYAKGIVSNSTSSRGSDRQEFNNRYSNCFSSTVILLLST